MNAIEGLANKQFLEPLLAATYIWGEKYIYICSMCYGHVLWDTNLQGTDSILSMHIRHP